MKLLILTAFILFSTSSMASYYQENCSNADGTIIYNQGHANNQLTLTVRKVVEGVVTDTKYHTDLVDKGFDVAVTIETELDHQETTVCYEGEEYGYYSGRTISYRKVMITSPGVPVYEQNFVGLSDDRTHVVGHLICEHIVDSEVNCAQ